ncbi:MAG: DUF1232 domain-containing protein [Coleofasciculaceae cyanobacterium SM2_3_26]|nr:DUF1232 domain-containing protein [Coleofasciculaceae cyanobacterium SM2_3_26]
MRAVLDSQNISESDRLAFYGALFAMASADGSIHPEESDLILQSVDRRSLSTESRAALDMYAENPPSLETCLEKLANASQEIQWNLMFYGMELVLADEAIARAERHAIQLVQAKFGITDGQMQAIEAFVRSMQAIGEAEVDEYRVAKLSRQAVEKLKQEGIPVPSPFSLENVAAIDTEVHYSEKKFWQKIHMFAVKAGRNTIEQALTLYYTLEQPHIPIKVKATIYGVLGYFILPLDIAPDFVPVLGFGDDAALLVAAIANTMVHITPEARELATMKVRELFGESVN